MLRTDRSKRVLASISHLFSHHSSGSSSGNVSFGYGSATSGSASDGSSDDDLVNRNRYDLGYDSEPERTLLRRREARRARQAALEQQLNMGTENQDDNTNMENQNRITLGQYINPTADSCGTTIRRHYKKCEGYRQIFLNFWLISTLPGDLPAEKIRR
ncbi:hypothetical protein PIB30_033419 [Stylosanthes scabra]|uniref:Uncharacterized protein n=1 Tax=Stylosanthes scabra TaxID=79078 RepID=A0ABU6SCN9_9FABA|nr:hypothetical protein [Stylosanthes scabra]